ncbi:uncharacterized protein LOC119298723 [Triticum dicoccoides]|uniref:uncharacterized protein LOC119298723 n=1 Tax=Triticum dicoccoides TaxID=85692 RepID=UPI0018901282|nr:uncharacterized protein LOC119298723 [Triticum dicoccoides]
MSATSSLLSLSLFHYSRCTGHLSSAHGAATPNLRSNVAPVTEATAGALVLFHYGGQSAKPPGSGVIFHSGGQISSSLGNTRSSEDAVLVHGSVREKSFSSLFPSMLLLIASLVMYKLCCCSSCPWQPRILLREELFPVRVVAALVYKCYFM